MGGAERSLDDIGGALVAVETIAQGDIWWAEIESDRRPVLVVSRDEAIRKLNRIVVAPITSNVRGIPTEVALDNDDGLSYDSAASFDNLGVLLKSHLTERVGSISHRRYEMCAALTAMADCW